MRSRRSYESLLVLLALVLVSAFGTSVVWGDTVHLKNGNWIHGVVQRETDRFVEIRVGETGRVSVSRDKILRIEKNEKDGGKSAPRVTEVTRGVGRQEPADGDPDSAESAPKSEEGQESEDATDDADAGDDVASKQEAPGDSEAEPIAPELEREIQEQIQELKRQRARNRVRAERRLDSIGKPALPYVLEIAGHDASLVRTAVFRFVLRHGDDSAIDACLVALDDENEFVRDFAHRALRQITNEDFGYRPLSHVATRNAAAKRWREWWAKEQKELESLRRKARD